MNFANLILYIVSNVSRKIPNFHGNGKIVQWVNNFYTKIAANDTLKIAPMKNGTLMKVDLRSGSEFRAYYCGSYDDYLIGTVTNLFDKNKIFFKPITVDHGDTKAYGYIFNKIAYISDCSSIPKNELKKLNNLNILIIDCLKFKKHKTHLNYNQAIKYIKIINPKKAILTNLHSDIDYQKLKMKLSKQMKNVVPAYDGMKIKL